VNDTYVIHVTKKCNMDCLYCYENDKVSEYSLEEIKKNIDFALSNLKSRSHIEYLGGEPMLRFDYIKDTYAYIKEKYNSIIDGFTITTNGTILTDDVLNFLKANTDIRFAVSIDGTKFANQLRLINDINSYDIVMNNLQILLKNNINCNVHIVTHPLNIAYLYNSIIHLYEKGIKSIGIGTIEKTMNIDEFYKKTFMEQIIKVSKFVNSNKDLQIDIFSYIKPKSDKRTYFKDKSGKTVFENYGRSDNYIDTVDLQKIECDSNDEISSMIFYLREFAFRYHNNDTLYILDEINKIIKDIDNKLGG